MASSPRLSPALNVVVGAVQKAGKRLLRDFGEVEQLQVSAKGPGDFVSAADIRAEETLRTELDRARPGFAFLMEESGSHGADDWEWRWVVDPLDGTSNFLHGIPHWASRWGSRSGWTPTGPRRRRRHLQPGLRRAVLGGEGRRRLPQRQAAPRLRPARHEPGALRHRHPLRRRAAQGGVLPDPRPHHAAGRRRPPLRLRRARPRLDRRRPLRRLLGAWHQEVGHGGRADHGA